MANVRRRSLPSHLVSSRLVSSRLVSSRLVSSRPLCLAFLPLLSCPHRHSLADTHAAPVLCRASVLSVSARTPEHDARYITATFNPHSLAALYEIPPTVTGQLQLPFHTTAIACGVSVAMLLALAAPLVFGPARTSLAALGLHARFAFATSGAFIVMFLPTLGVVGPQVSVIWRPPVDKAWAKGWGRAYQT